MCVCMLQCVNVISVLRLISMLLCAIIVRVFHSVMFFHVLCSCSCCVIVCFS